MTTFKKSKDLIILSINGLEVKLWGLVAGAYDKRLREYMDIDYIEKLVLMLSNPLTNQSATDALIYLNDFLEGHYQDFYKGKSINWTEEQKKWNSANKDSMRRDVMNNKFRGQLSDESTQTFAELAEQKAQQTRLNKSLANKRRSKSK